MGSESVFFWFIFCHTIEKKSGGFFFQGRLLLWWIFDINLKNFTRGYFSTFLVRVLIEARAQAMDRGGVGPTESVEILCYGQSLTYDDPSHSNSLFALHHPETKGTILIKKYWDDLRWTKMAERTERQKTKNSDLNQNPLCHCYWRQRVGKFGS